MMRLAAILSALALAACLFDNPRVAGGGSETEYLTLTGVVTLPNGAPAAGCRISVRPANWVYDPELPPGPGSTDTVTDAKGKYAIKVLPAGEYRVEGSLQDTLGFAANVLIPPRDTGKGPLANLGNALRRDGGLSIGIAADKPDIDYFVQVYGMQRHALADSLGSAHVTLPPGVYRIRIVTSPRDFAPAEFSEVEIRSGADTILPAVVLPALKGSAALPLIFDSNIGFAVDDAAALSMIHVLADRGEVVILAAGTSNPSRSSPAVLDAIDTYHGRAGIPVGAWKGEKPVNRTGYDSAVAAEFPQDLPVWDSLPDAATVYRRALEGQPDGSAVLLCTGDARNAWALLRAAPAVVARKVKALVMIGGKYPSGMEFNFHASIARDTLPNMIREVAKDWPGPIHFTGTETGDDMATGGCLATAGAGGPLKRIYDLGLGAPNAIKPSTDIVGALYAVRGVQSYWSLHTGGGYVINDDGSDVWDSTLVVQHAALIRRGGPEGAAAAVDSLLCSMPNP